MVLRGLVGMILGMRGVTGCSVSMVPSGFVVTILVMLCSFRVMLSCHFVVFSSLFVMGCAFMVRHSDLLFRVADRSAGDGHLCRRSRRVVATRRNGQFREPPMTSRDRVVARLADDETACQIVPVNLSRWCCI
jgi:hypothetical protein